MALFGALTAVSAGLGIFGQLRQRNSDKQISAFNAAQLRKRSRLTRQLAQQTVERTREAQIFRQGLTVAEFAARGIAVDRTSSVLDQLTTQARIDEANNAALLFEADIQSYDAESNARLIEFSAKNNARQQGLSIFGSGLQAIANPSIRGLFS